MASKTSIPEPVLRRFPRYIHCLHHLRSRDVDTVSTSMLAEQLGVATAVAKKDMQYLNVEGKNRVGYDIVQLIHAIEELLGWNNPDEAVLAGAGNLGCAIMGYDRLQNYGVHIVSAFDTDPGKTGTNICGVEVLDISHMTSLIKRLHIRIGIITAPAKHAQAIAEAMVDGGIMAIWNFAPVALKLPPHIIVQDTQLYASLSVLSQKLKERLDAST